jgi:hypothetical protein
LTYIVFPASPLQGGRPDESFHDEVDAARASGFEFALIDLEALLDDDAERAVRRVQPSEGMRLGIYRGWMLPIEAYARCYEALQRRGMRLINDPEQYRTCHHLNAAYPFIAERSVQTIFIPFEDRLNFETIHARLDAFDGAAILVKDYVKSRKHEWLDACYVRSAGDRGEVERVTRNFVERQGPDLIGGLAYRAYRELHHIGSHPRSGMPLSLEFRAFVLDGEIVLTAPYWGEETLGHVPPIAEFAAIAKAVPSRFFTLDFALGADGHWIIIEAGDGQVSAIPEGTPPTALYKQLLLTIERPAT